MSKCNFLQAIPFAVLAMLSPSPLAARPAVQETPSSAPQSSVPAAHQVKVWTNEDLIATRTPADNYVFQKEAQVAEQQDAAFAEIASCFALAQPAGNAQETQKAIDDTIQSIRESEQAVAQAQRALRAAPENLKPRNQMELSQRTAELNHAREQLWKLQEHLREIEKTTAQDLAPSKPPPN
jgi:small-conductance mechanosensitive channel